MVSARGPLHALEPAAAHSVSERIWMAPGESGEFGIYLNFKYPDFSQEDRKSGRFLFSEIPELSMGEAMTRRVDIAPMNDRGRGVRIAKARRTRARRRTRTRRTGERARGLVDTEGSHLGRLLGGVLRGAWRRASPAARFGANDSDPTRSTVARSRHCTWPLTFDETPRFAARSGEDSGNEHTAPAPMAKVHSKVGSVDSDDRQPGASVAQVH